jgi:polycystin 1L2
MTNSFKILDLRKSVNLQQQSYLFFLNANQTGNFKGLIGIGIRELKNDELLTYCGGIKTTPATPPIAASVSSNGTNGTEYSRSLSSDFSFLSYTSGCYYMDLSTGKWSSEGVDVESDTSILFTHCKTSHLTTFAGGWIVVPSAINFDYVFANASIEKNPTIYATVISLACLFILFVIWGRYMDKQDVKKIGVAPLPDNQPGDNYFYEIIAFTGSRKDAGTDSKVNFRR